MGLQLPISATCRTLFNSIRHLKTTPPCVFLHPPSFFVPLLPSCFATARSHSRLLFLSPTTAAATMKHKAKISRCRPLTLVALAERGRPRLEESEISVSVFAASRANTQTHVHVHLSQASGTATGPPRHPPGDANEPTCATG